MVVGGGIWLLGKKKKSEGAEEKNEKGGGKRRKLNQKRGKRLKIASFCVLKSENFRGPCVGRRLIYITRGKNGPQRGRRNYQNAQYLPLLNSFFLF